MNTPERLKEIARLYLYDAESAERDVLAASERLEELEQANMALTAKLRQMHRRAQKAEGQRNRALHEVEAWQRVFGRTRGTGVQIIHHFALTIVNSLQKVLTK